MIIKSKVSASGHTSGGFTLIEIIAALIILGILAAVAVPRFTNLMEDAAQKSVAAVKSELQARASQYFSEYLLDPSDAAKAANNAQTLAAWAAEDVGADFTLGSAGGNITVVTQSSSTVFTIQFVSVGVSATDSTGSPAIFGDIGP